MDTSAVQSLVDQLEDNIDDLEDILQPIISQALGESTKKLPLLDKAKLHIMIVYAIESLLFSYLKLHNVDAKQHPIFRELTRVKQYFEKVKLAEEGPIDTKPQLSLNKQAAARIIQHSLAGNDKLDLARLEREAREKLLAKRKPKDLETSMKERAQMADTEPDTTEEKLVNQIIVEIERAEGNVSADTTNQDDAKPQSDGKAKKDKKRKRSADVGTTKPQNEGEAGDTKTKKLNKKAKKKAKLAAQAPG